MCIRDRLKANWPIVWYFLYCLLSVIWSDFPDISIKRWIKATGDVVMALVVVTDAQPVAALRRLFSRVGFLLIPASALLIKYYPYLGRKYDPWIGTQSVTGVTTDKNLLGVTTYILALGALWQALRLWRESSLPNRSRQLLAQCTLLGFGIWIQMCIRDSREGSAVMDFKFPAKTVIGELDPASGATVATLYEKLDAPLIRVDLETAEMVKYIDNAWHARCV